MTIEALESLIIEGMSYRDMSRHFGIHLIDLTNFIAKDEHSARARAALEASADIFAEMAEEVLKAATWNARGQDFDLKKARELAQHYRWKAAKRNPRKYSDKIQTENTNLNINATTIIDWSEDQRDQADA